MEGLRLLADADELSLEVMRPLEALGAKTMRYHIGNHEDWIDDLIEENPGIEGLVDIRKLLSLDEWDVITQGKYSTLGKLTFMHGDQLKGGANIAKSAVTDWERSVRFGHYHTFQAHTKVSPMDEKLGRTGVSVPCLCSKSPKYGEGRANSWVQGFNYGYVHPDGSYNDYVAIITNGRTMVHGKTYKG
jgi:hypothetical protein